MAILTSWSYKDRHITAEIDGSTYRAHISAWGSSQTIPWWTGLLDIDIQAMLEDWADDDAALDSMIEEDIPS